MSAAWGSDRDIAVVVGSEHLRNLRQLGVWDRKVTDGGLADLAAWPFAAELRSVDLKNNPITDAGAFVLAGRERLRERYGDALHLYAARSGITPRR